MKRFIALALNLIMVLSFLCGCSFADTVSYIEKAFSEGDIAEVETVTEEYYIISPEFDSCYNSLNAKQREIYKKLYNICEKMTKGYVRLCRDYDDSVKDITIAYRAVLNDHTEIFWMPDTFIIGRNYNSSGTKDICITFENSSGKKRVKYPVTLAQRDKMKKQLETVVKTVVDKAQGLETQFEKEKFFNDYICQNTEYAKETGLVNTAYGCLVNKKALCEGYSRAFKLLCNKSGIECELIVGKADGEGHMWNVVNIDGMHSHIDVTWNDRPDYPYFYFNLTDSQLSFDHKISPLYTEVSAKEINAGTAFNFVKRDCGYQGNGYYAKHGYVLGDDFEKEYAHKAAEFITKSVKNKAKYADFLLKSDYIKDVFSADEKAFIRNVQKKLDGIKITSYAFERDILVFYWDE